MNILHTYPNYLDEIIRKLLSRNWLVHNFNIADDLEIYNISNYLYNKKNKGVTYNICLDLNIYQFIINAYKKNNAKDEFRDAIALIIFCQITEIELDPTQAVYEKINNRHDALIIDETISDLMLFYRINNTDTTSLVPYALGLSDTITIKQHHESNQTNIKESLTKHNRLTEWDSLYLIVIHLIYISLIPNISRLERIKKVVEWMIQEFRLSLVGITFAAIYFGEKPMKKMMKYRQADDSDTKKRSAFNMTWDLYNLNRYFRMWTESPFKQETMFASGDKVFNVILMKSIEIQKTGTLECFDEMLPQDVVTYIAKITSQPHMCSIKRVYGSEDWTPAYRTELIQKYESLIGITNNKI